jgi:hypothetical protein
MKKTALLVLAILLAASTFAFAAQGWGIGAVYSFDLMGKLPAEALLTIAAKQLPVVIGVGVALNQDSTTIGATCDWWLYKGHLAGMVDMYVGPGLYLMVPDIEFGGRVPVGFRIFPVGKIFELFAEIAPSIAIISNQDNVTIPNIFLQAGLGFRFWF